MEWILYTVVAIIALISVISLFIIWVIIQIVLPLIVIASMGYGLFFLGTMAYGSRRAKPDRGGEENDSGGL